MSIKNLNKFTQFSLTTSLVFLVYGYFCRLVNLNFFWESKTIGWTIFMIGLISLLSDWINYRDEQDKKSIIQKVIIGFIVFGLLLETILMIAIPVSDAYEAAKTYVKNDNTLKEELGEIKGFGLIPIGGIGKTTRGTGEVSGNANINMIIKGDKKFKDVVIFVIKTEDSPDWKVVRVE